MKAKKKLLLASVAVGVVTPFITSGGIVHAESVEVLPEESSDNTVEVNETNYSINGETTELGEDDTYGTIYGSYPESGDATNNTVTINGGTFGNVYGGYSFSGNVTGNTLTINGGTFYSVYGGYSWDGDASNNIVNLYGGTFYDIYGGYAPSGETSGNVLNIYNKNISAQNIYNFDNLNFYIPNDVSSGDTMLTLTGSVATGTETAVSTTTDLSGVTIRAGIVAGNSNLAVGDTINLIQNSNGFITDADTTYGTLTEGVSLDYGLTVSNSGSNIIATIDSVPQDLNIQTQAIPLSAGLTSIKTLDTVLDNNNLPATGLDFDFEDDNDDTDAAEVSDIQVMEPKGWEIFASAGGGSLRTKAGDGAYVDMKSTSFDLGLARTLNNGGAGKLAFAPIIDYAHGNYDSYLTDGTHGTGSTKYIAGGGVFRNMWNNGFYVEGSFRAGKVKTDFASENMDKTFGQRVSYDTDATAMAGHLKLGKNLRLGKNNLLDVYATYYHAHQGGMNADLNPYGDQYKISSADSGRFRIGYRLTTRISKISRIYTGFAYQYEHTDGISATYLSKNLSTRSAGNSGSSGMLEIGWVIKPLKNNPWAVDINATGWAGHQRGVTAMAKISKSF